MNSYIETSNAQCSLFFFFSGLLALPLMFCNLFIIPMFHMSLLIWKTEKLIVTQTWWSTKSKASTLHSNCFSLWMCCMESKVMELVQNNVWDSIELVRSLLGQLKQKQSSLSNISNVSKLTSLPAHLFPTTIKHAAELANNKIKEMHLLEGWLFVPSSRTQVNWVLKDFAKCMKDIKLKVLSRGIILKYYYCIVIISIVILLFLNSASQFIRNTNFSIHFLRYDTFSKQLHKSNKDCQKSLWRKMFRDWPPQTIWEADPIHTRLQGGDHFKTFFPSFVPCPM